MGDKGKRDKGKRENQKKSKLTPKEKRKQKRTARAFSMNQNDGSRKGKLK